MANLGLGGNEIPPLGGNRGRDKAHVARALGQLQAEWQGWLDAGMPQREPLSKAELERRIQLLGDARLHLRGNG